MKQLRHDRPIFKYVDNLTRELRKASGGLTDQATQIKPERHTPSRLLRPKDDNAYQRVLAAFEILPEDSQNIIGVLLDLAVELSNARINLLKDLRTLGNPKRKAAYDDALSSLREACGKFEELCARETAKGKSASRAWWAKFRISMGCEWEPYEEIDEFIKEARTR